VLNRRRFLTLGGAAAGAVLLPRAVGAGAEPATAGSIRPSGTAAATPPPFSVRMPVPPVLAPAASRPDADLYRVAIQPATASILPGLRTPVLAYNGHFIGPTIRARSGRRTVVAVTNQLDTPANVHLHGGHVSADNDGHPMDVITPGGTRSYTYPNRQPGATLWYHDHAHHLEAEHVFRGLHGFYLIEGPDEPAFGLPAGAYDVPILLRDSQFDDTGALVVNDVAHRGTILANGKPQPYFPVAARKYRFRLLNGSTERLFRLDLGGAEMTQIGTDGGLLPAPAARTEVLLGSAERVEIVVDFSRYPVGTSLVLADSVAGPVLRFDVVRTAEDPSRVPETLRPLPPLPALPPTTVTREVAFTFDLTGGAPVGLINGQPYDPTRVDFQVKRGSTEIWRITNADTQLGGINHTFHLHLVQFRVLDRDGSPPWADDAGLKDTIYVPPNTSARIQATFTEFLGRYVYHCHFLEHSAFGMMAQLEIVP
jgi:FtsP/CotA-like multicopper oxidase with cupredoxin domain